MKTTQLESPFALNTTQQFNLNLADFDGTISWEIENYVKTFVRPEIANEGADALIKLLKQVKDTEQEAQAW